MKKIDSSSSSSTPATSTSTSASTSTSTTSTSATGPSATTAPTLIDVGTCFGQDLRKLAYDGVPPNQLLGSDVLAAFEAIGQAFFRDSARFAGRFKAADIFAVERSAPELLGAHDVVTATMVLHSFDWATQALACKSLIALARGRGSWIMGGLSAGAPARAGEHWLEPPFVPAGVRKNVYRHDRESFVRLWQEVGRELGVELDVFADYEAGASEARRAAEEGGASFFGAAELRLLWFRVVIL